MNIRIRTPRERTHAAGLVFGVTGSSDLAASPLWRTLTPAGRKLASGMRRRMGKAALGTIVDSAVGSGAQRILLVSAGERRIWSQHRFAPLIRKVAQQAKLLKLPELAFTLDDWLVPGVSTEELAGLLVENVRLANYRYPRRSPSSDAGFSLTRLEIVVAASTKALRDRIRRATVVSDAVDACRTLANTPGGDLTPQLLAKSIRTLAAPHGIRTTILGKREIEKLGMGGLLGVARGSSEEPRFLIMEYRGTAVGKPVVLVGKGITFDSGGLNVKPGEHMTDMHLDMSGAAAVAAAMIAAARLKLPLPVIGLIPAAENMPSGSGYRPGDVLRSLSGKTIEIVNTDAEGRVILADALVYAERYKPRFVVDIATLTGSATVALGPWISGLQTPTEGLLEPLRAIGEATGDYVWPMPLWEEYADHIKGTFGDVLNSSRKRGEAGMITAALFLKEFVKGYVWAHLDIASTMVTAEGQYLAKGASGAGVRFLVELLTQIADGRFQPGGRRA